MFSGSIPALVTPFDADGGFDEGAYRDLVEWQIAEGSSALVPCGTTGEAALLTMAEQRQLIETALSVSRGRVPVIAGAGSNNTATAVELAVSAEQAGAQALLSATPAYLKPTQAGVIADFRAIHDAVRIPVILYDVPSRTACPLNDLSIKRLTTLPRIVGLKDATADVPRVARLRRRVGREFLLLSGGGATQSEFRAAGGDGCISITANVAPALCAALHRAHDRGRFDEVQRLSRILRPLHAALFLEANPIPLKRALHRLKLIEDGLRLPLTPLAPAADRHLAAVLERIMPAAQVDAARFAAASPLIAPRAA